jgi:hypothetical protein
LLRRACQFFSVSHLLTHTLADPAFVRFYLVGEEEEEEEEEKEEE